MVPDRTEFFQQSPPEHLFDRMTGADYLSGETDDTPDFHAVWKQNLGLCMKLWKTSAADVIRR